MYCIIDFLEICALHFKKTFVPIFDQYYSNYVYAKKGIMESSEFKHFFGKSFFLVQSLPSFQMLHNFVTGAPWSSVQGLDNGGFHAISVNEPGK